MGALSNNVTLRTQFNQSPYWDDFTETKNFMRLLFNPERGVQARELTQSQTIRDNQLSRFANHIFKDGSKVAGGEHILDLQVQYVRLRDTNALGNTVNVNNYVGKELTGATTGVKAYVITAETGSEAADPDTKTLIVKYISANTAGQKTFITGENLTANNGFTARVYNIGTPVGNASIFTVKEGIVYAKGFFVHHPEQTIILEKYSKYPTYRVGFKVAETIVTTATDTSLLDPAQGASAYQSPGADRLQLTATLTKLALANNDPDFIELFTIKSGVVQTRADRPQYSDIRDELARRTYDESGDYVVSGLTVKLREHLNDGENLGLWSLSDNGNTQQLAVGIEPGTAYVKGYDYESLVTRWLPIKKGIDFKDVEGLSVAANYGSYVLVKELVGFFDVYKGAVVSLYNTAEQRLTLKKGSTTVPGGSKIGEARVRAIVHDSGTPGTPNAVYRLYLYDIRMTSGAFTAVRHIYINHTTEADGGADTVLESGSAVLYESGFRSLVNPIPLRAMRRIRDVNNTIDMTYEYISAYDVTIATSGTFTVNSATDETFPYSAGALNTTQKRSNFHVILNAAAESSNLTGTVSVSTSSNVVSGVGTNFTNVFTVGDHIKVGATIKRVTVLTSANSLQVDSNWGSTSAGQKAVRYYYAGTPIDMGSKGANAVDRTITINSSTSATFNLGEGLGVATSAKVISNMRKVDGREKRKLLRATRYVQINCGTHAATSNGPWCLGFSDVFKINFVRKKGTAFTSPTEGTDVTAHFILDNGQRDWMYDLGYLKKGPTASVAGSDYLLVSLDYFYHDTSQGDGYLSVDSYPIDDNNAANTTAIMTKEIPLFTSPVSGLTYDLRDSIDARPVMAITAADATTVGTASTNPSATSTFQLGLKGLYTPVPNQSYVFDASYYLGRKDLVVLDSIGTYRTVTGIPSLYPITPEIPADSMALAAIEITPYPSLPPNIANDVERPDYACRVKHRANKRYTMRDIGVLDQRITNLEYYNSLSLLERETAEMKILDDNGLDRFKNGFVVDPFQGTAVANIYDPDYNAAIDPLEKELRPPFHVNNVGMEFSSTSTNIYRCARDATITLVGGSGSFANGEIVYQGANLGSATATGRVVYAIGSTLELEQVVGTFANNTTTRGATSLATGTTSSITTPLPGDLALVPYTHRMYFEQPFATTVRNCAGLMYSWVGYVDLVPDGDHWTDTTQLPETRINFDGNLDAWTWLVNAWGTEWGDWTTRWTGQQTIGQREVTENIRSISEVDWWAGGMRTRTFEDFRVETTIRTTTEQTRRGVKYSVVPETITQSTGNRVVDVTVQPYMRSRIILVRAEGMKPNTRIYAFFDSEAVSQYIRPVNTAAWNSLVVYSNLLTTGATPQTSVTALPMNISGFNPAWVGAEGAALTTDADGRFLGFFRIPNDDTKRFPVGTKRFRLSDSITNSSTPGQVTTSGEVSYTASGMHQSVQDTVISTRKINIVANNVSENRTLQSINTNINRGTRQIGESFESFPPPSDGGGGGGGGDGGDGGGEPVAQSWMVRVDENNAAGFFVTKIDLYFQTKHPTLPVFIEIREMENSNVMTPRVVPFSQVTVPSSAVRTSADASLPTTIVFPSPVFLSRGFEYALVVRPGANNPDYRIWIAEIGQNDILTGRRVVVSPFMGTLFASANDRTYQPQQLEDFKMKFYIAEFSTGVTGNLYMQNQRKEFMTLANTTNTFGRVGEQVRGEPTLVLSTLSGTANVGNRIHGNTSGTYGTITQANNVSRTYRLKDVPTGALFTAGENVTFKFTNGTNTGASGNNITITQPFGFVDHYFDTAANTALHLSGVGVSSFKVGMQIKGQTSNTIAFIGSDIGLKMNVFHPQVRQIILPRTSISWSAKTTTSDTHVLDTTWSQIAVNADNETPNERKVLSATDEDDDLAGARSFQLKADLSTNDRFVSPIVDLKYSGAIIVQNIINDDATNETSARGGNAKARYISRKVTLGDDQDAEDLKVYLSVYQPTTTTVKVYAKFLHGEDSTLFNDRPWVEMVRSGSSFSSTENRNDFREAEFNLPTSILTGPNGAVQYVAGSVTFTGFKYFAIKIVLLSPNTSLVPRVRELRGIGLQK